MVFKNYHAMINRSPGLVRTIFPVTGPAGAFYEVLVSGCGEINPLENDHGAAVYRYQNQGAIEWLGYVIGEGPAPAMRSRTSWTLGR